MHRALKVPEILNLIFKDNFSDRDLVRCALVCRLWGIWTLDLLWGTRPIPFHNVLRFLAPAIKRIEIESWNKDPSALVAYWEIGKIDPDGWRRFVAISNKITIITIDLGIGEKTIEQIKHATRSFNDLGEPFSNLRTLRIGSGGIRWHHTFTYTLSLVTVPSLSHVLLGKKSSMCNTIDWVCNSVPAIAPNVTHLVLGRVWALNAEASRYAALKYLQIQGGFPTQLWESLASCPLLEKIVLVWCTIIGSVLGYENPDLAWRVNYVYFPALRTLKFRRGYPNIIVALILRSRMPMLEHLCCDGLSAPFTGNTLDHVLVLTNKAPYVK
ncbi:hypothetical protein FRC00_003290 [Tulasnella sp. 408]|nr:hypothetical protein FRC00_003290 [Tulasnella sp. 408]